MKERPISRPNEWEARLALNESLPLNGDDHGAEILSTTDETAVVERKIEGTFTLPFAPIAQALAEVPDEPEWDWQDFSAPGSILLIAGIPKVGKSVLVYALLSARDREQLFLGRATRSTGAVLLSEERPYSLADKVRRWPLTNCSLLMRHQAHGVPWRKVAEQATEYALTNGLGCVVVDTFDKWAGLRGDAENSAGAVVEALEPLVRAAAAGLGVIIVTHQRKAGGQHGSAVRGSNALTGGVDVVLEVERARTSTRAEQSVRVLNAVSRFASTPDRIVARLVGDDYELVLDDGLSTEETGRSAVRAALNGTGVATSKEELASVTGLSPSTVARRADELVERAEVERSGEGKKGSPYNWQIVSTTSRSQAVETIAGRREQAG